MTINFKKLFLGSYDYYLKVSRELADILHDPYIPAKTRRRIGKLVAIRLDINWRDSCAKVVTDTDQHDRTIDALYPEYDNRKPDRQPDDRQGELL